jgi:hypothetical protein
MLKVDKIHTPSWPLDGFGNSGTHLNKGATRELLKRLLKSNQHSRKHGVRF